MTAVAPIAIPRHRNPFPEDTIVKDADGTRHYAQLPNSLLAMLREHVHNRPDSEAIVEVGGRRLSYAELWREARHVAGGLIAHGLQPGDRVAISYPAGVNWVLAFWGTLMAGGVALAMNIRMAPPEVEYVLKDSGAKLHLIADTPLPDGDAIEVVEGSLDTVAAFFYTSGTTGSPKGVPTTNEAFLTNAENMLTCMSARPEDPSVFRTLISVPLFHVTGCNSQLLTAAYLGGTSVILPSLDLATLIDLLATERISSLITVPAVYQLLLRHPAFKEADVSSVRWVGYGGAPIATSTVIALKEAFPKATVSNGYGMTETASLMTVLPDADAIEHPDSVGYAVPSVDLAILPVDGGDDTTGELLARGANVARSYWNKPEATADSWLDGWLRTGDVVKFDGDGRIYIVDRVKDIINRSGENVSSIEVEDALASAPGVAEAAVLAVPDFVMGVKVGAVLVGTGEALDVEAVITHLKTRLADYKVPQYVAVVKGPLPRNAGGKLLKRNLRTEVEWGKPLR